jgi:hypothetical protein
MKIRSMLPILVLLAAGCASTSAGGIQRLEPGQTVEFDGRAYQLLQVQEDFVLMRYRDPATEPGAISGFLDEVFRISRYDLGEGRWYANEKLPGVYLQWMGLDSFGLAHDRKVLGNAEVVMLR